MIAKLRKKLEKKDGETLKLQQTYDDSWKKASDDVVQAGMIEM